MTDRLTVYNMALGHLAERKLGSLSEAREPRRVLDDYWDQEVLYCLERKLWNFVYRTVQMDPSSTIVPGFGFNYAFAIPKDWVRTRLLSASETLTPPLLQMKEENGLWFTNVTPIFVQYNSKDPLYGMDLGKWPASFTDYVSLRLARQACKRITGKADFLDGPQGLIRQEQKACTVAAANCAMNDPIGFAPRGRWVSSRRSGGGGDNPSGSLVG